MYVVKKAFHTSTRRFRVGQEINDVDLAEFSQEQREQFRSLGYFEDAKATPPEPA